MEWSVPGSFGQRHMQAIAEIGGGVHILMQRPFEACLEHKISDTPLLLWTGIPLPAADDVRTLQWRDRVMVAVGQVHSNRS